jgi:hypothetical protein
MKCTKKTSGVGRWMKKLNNAPLIEEEHDSATCFSCQTLEKLLNYVKKEMTTEGYLKIHEQAKIMRDKLEAESELLNKVNEL